MYKILKKDTASQKITVYLVDATDGYTPETAVTSPTIYLSKAGAAPAVPNDGSFAALNSTNMPGVYTVTLNATDTNTVGELTIRVVKTGTSREFVDRYTVVAAQVYDSILAGSDLLKVDVDELDGSAASATKLEQAARAYKYGTVAAGTSPTATTFETDSITEATADHFNGRLVVWLSGNLANGANLDSKVTRITDYALSGGKGAFTVESMGESPAVGDAFLIV